MNNLLIYYMARRKTRKIRGGNSEKINVLKKILACIMDFIVGEYNENLLDLSRNVNVEQSIKRYNNFYQKSRSSSRCSVKLFEYAINDTNLTKIYNNINSNVPQLGKTFIGSSDGVQYKCTKNVIYAFIEYAYEVMDFQGGRDPDIDYWDSDNNDNYRNIVVETADTIENKIKQFINFTNFDLVNFGNDDIFELDANEILHNEGLIGNFIIKSIVNNFIDGISTYIAQVKSDNYEPPDRTRKFSSENEQNEYEAEHKRRRLEFENLFKK